MNNEPLISAHFPYIPIRIEFGHQSHEVECLLDTGFDGDIAIP